MFAAKRNFEQATQYHEQLMRVAQEIGDKSIEARAYAGLGHATRCTGDLQQAKQWYEKQLDISLVAKDKVSVHVTRTCVIIHD